MAVTENQKKVFNIVAEDVRNGRKVSVSRAMKKSGVYAKTMIKHPDKVTKSEGWKELMNTFLPDSLLSKTHLELLKSTRLDHMTFPLGCKLTSEKEDYMALAGKDPMKEKGEILSDEEITEMLANVNCTVRKIVHGQTARHVYFWVANDNVRDSALDKGYKLKGKYAPDKHQSVVAHIDATKSKKIKEILGIN